MYRIYFDSNARRVDGRYDLGIPGSVRDIVAAGNALTPGTRVLLYMEDVEVEAALDWDGDPGQWWACPYWNTLRHLNEAAQPPAAAE
jgi:hypothetical protein